MHASATQPAPVLGLLDIGTAKIACAIVVLDGGGAPRLLGLGHQYSRGLKASIVIDTEAAEDAVRAAVAQAEAMAGVRLSGVTVATAAGRLSSQYLSLGGDVMAGAAVATEVERLFGAVHEHVERQEQAALHLEALAFSLNGVPLAMHGQMAQHGRMAVDAHVIVAERSPLRALMQVVERCQLVVHQVLPSPLAAALGVTTEAERKQGVIVLDCGAGTTGMAVFLDGQCVAAHVLQIGGNHLTYDLTRELGLPLNECERIKKNYDRVGLAHASTRSGSAHNSAAKPVLFSGIHAHSEPISGSEQVTRARILPIITKRVLALLQNVLERLERTALPAERLPLVVVTGGGAHLRLLMEQASLMFKKPTRIGVPDAASGWPGAVRVCEFATLAGLQHMEINARQRFVPAAVAMTPAGIGMQRSYPHSLRRVS